MPMNIGFVYVHGEFGMSIRIKAMRNHLLKKGFKINDIELRAIPKQSNNASSMPLHHWITPKFMSKLILKALRGKQYSLFNDLLIGEQIETFQKSIKSYYIFTVGLCNEVDIMHAETHIPAYICSLVKKERNIPYVFDMHGLLVEELKQRGCSNKLLEFWNMIEKQAILDADRVIVVSHLMKEKVHEVFNKPFSKISVIPNGSELYHRRARYHQPIRIIYGGVFDPYERVIDFVKTAEKIPRENYEFFLMGDGFERNAILNYINNNDIYISYLGKKNRQLSLDIFCDMHIGIAPSTNDIIRKTASPIKILDYAACGLPIVTVNVGEWSEKIKEYDCGIVVNTSDPLAFSNAIKELTDEKIWQRKADNGLMMIREECSWEKVLHPLVSLYSTELLGAL
ncbi:MAG: glycosyltransferase [Elusimicrobia bacterium]|nr:glycosyltransferase [Elusimicrobiota bacterium]